MKFSEELHKAILVGTNRAPLTSLFTSTDFPEDLLELIQARLQNGPQALWSAIALQDLWLRAGHTLSRESQEFQPTPTRPAAEQKPICPPQAQELASIMLRGIHTDLFEYWLKLASHHGFIIAPKLIVPVLTKFADQKHLRNTINATLGERGHWVVRQHPAWRSLFHHMPSQLDFDSLSKRWSVAPSQERPALLKEMRDLDAPASLTLLEQDWPNESAENRPLLIQGLEHGLSERDEAFLEQALDDKRKEVRIVAQRLLRLIPTSKRSQRCLEYLRSSLHFVVHEAPSRSVKLEVKLPELADKNMKRDGLGAQSFAKLGEKANLLRDIIANAPISVWFHELNVTPQELVHSVSENEFHHALLSGILEAIQTTTSDADVGVWIETLIDCLADSKTQFDHRLYQDLITCLLQLKIEQREALLLRCLTRATQNDQIIVNYWSQSINGHVSHTQSMSSHFSKVWLRHLQARMKSPTQHPWELKPYFKASAYCLAIEDLGYTEEGWPDEDWPEWTHWRESISEFRNTLKFRKQIKNSFMERT